MSKKEDPDKNTPFIWKVKRPKGRFSWRHETHEANDASRERYQTEHGPVARRRKAEERRHDRGARTSEQQLAMLDERLGNGVGATSERARLEAMIAV